MRVVAKLIWLSIDLTQCPPVAASRRPGQSEDIGACFVVKDSTGHKLAAVYCEEEPGRSAAKLLTKDETQRIAA
jgi:hypothetical protein